MSEPISFEVMTDRRLNHLETTLSEIQNTLKKMYGAITGDDEFDQLGIITRIKKLEAEAENTKNFKNKLLGMAAAVGTGSAIAFEVIKLLFN